MEFLLQTVILFLLFQYHIRRPKVEQEAWGRYTYDNYY
jgi:hypothetical protein